MVTALMVPGAAPRGTSRGSKCASPRDGDGVQLDFEAVVELRAAYDERRRAVPQQFAQSRDQCGRPVDVAEIELDPHEIGERRARALQRAFELPQRVHELPIGVAEQR